MTTRTTPGLAAACIIVTAALIGSAGAGSPAVRDVRPLPRDDQKMLDQYLGKGVVGEAVEASPLEDPSKFYPIAAGTLSYRLTSGKNKGATEIHVRTVLKRDTPGSSMKETWGDGDALFLNRAEDGSIFLVTHNEHAEGMITQYSPPEPMGPKGMKPGDSVKSRSDVKVFDLSHPDHLSHKGYLNLTFTYVGAYKVTVPNGSYDAALLKWTYKGKIGPAHVVDVQYRLVAEGVGTVAEIERKKVSAMLLYNDKSKTGKVLIATK